jgi:hypothetical protein
MKLKPYGLTQEDKEEPYVRIIPKRVQKLIDLYRLISIERIMLNTLGVKKIRMSRYLNFVNH